MPSQRLQMGSHLAQGRSNVIGRLVPEFVKLRTDERPILDACGGDGTTRLPAPRLAAISFTPSTALKPSQVAGPMTMPRLITVRIAAGEPRATAEKPGKEIEDRIERDGEDDAPGQDRHKGTDQNERPVDQEGEQSEPDRKLDEVLSDRDWRDGFQGRRLHLRVGCGHQATGRFSR